MHAGKAGRPAELGQSMSSERQAAIWLVLLALLVGFVALFSGIMLPFLAGLMIAYLLDPLVDFLERRGLGRFTATALVVAATSLVATMALVLMVPLLLVQLREFAEQLPATIERLRTAIDAASSGWIGQGVRDWLAGAGPQAGELSKAGAEFAAGLLRSLLSGGLAFVNFLSLLLVTPVVTFFLLLDWDRMIAALDGWLPRDHAATIRRIAREIDEVLAGFIRGQGTVALLLGIMYAVGLSFVGLQHAVLVGLLAGIVSFVPFVGSLTGFLVAMLLAVSQFWPEWLPIAQVALVFVVGQAIEGNVLSPKIVGGRVKLHPVWLIFSLFAFSYLLGIVGLLIAVPVAAAIGVLVRFALEEYRRSALYLGGAPDGTAASAGEANQDSESGAGRGTGTGMGTGMGTGGGSGGHA